MVNRIMMMSSLWMLESVSHKRYSFKCLLIVHGNCIASVASQVADSHTSLVNGIGFLHKLLHPNNN